jgi:hypothetical protein
MSFGTLLIVFADGRTMQARLERASVRIGREADNDIIIDDPSVSAYHARIFASADRIAILDLASRNGTEVDGQLITSLTPLTSGSHVRLGGVRLNLSPPNAAAEPDFVLPIFPEAPSAATQTTAVGLAAAANPAATGPQGPPLVRLDLQPAQARADISTAGPVILSFSATVQNLSRFVDRIELSLDAPPWVEVRLDPPAHNLKPGDSGQSRIELSVPRSSEASAGEHSIELVARSQKRPELRFAAAAQLTVSPFSEFRFELLEPRARTAWTGARYRVQTTNRGNQARPFKLEGINTDGALTFRFKPDPLTLQPGERQQSDLRARFKLLRLFGRAKTYDFALTGEPLDQSAPIQQAQGRLIQRPPLPPWMLISGAVLSLLALLFACSSLLLRNRDNIAGFFRSAFDLPTPTALVVAAVPDAAGTASALEAAFAQTQAAINQDLAQSAEAVSGANSVAQTAQAEAGAATQAALQTAGAATQTAAAVEVTGTAQAVATILAGTSTAQAQTSTAQTVASGTAIAATFTTLANTPTSGPVTPTPTVPTPTLAPPISPAAGQVITFDRVRDLPVNVRVPIRGDEYAGQEAFFCFYRPEPLLGQAAAIPASYLRQPPPDGVSISDVTQLEGSGGGTTNFVFTVTWRDTPIVINGLQARPAFQDRVLTIEYATRDGGPLQAGQQVATSPADYLPQSGTVVLILGPEASETSATITIPVIADDLFEADEVFSVVLSNPAPTVNLTKAVGAAIIQNDDPSPTNTPTATNTATPINTATPTNTITPTNTATPINTATPTSTPTVGLPEPIPPPAGDAFDCRPPLPVGTSLRLLRGVIYPPPVVAANSGPLHSLTTDAGENELISRAIAVANFQRNIAEVNVNLWYPGGEAATYVMFAFDERGALIASARRDAIGVPSTYQLNIRSLERPVRQILIEARRNFAGDFDAQYRFDPVVPPLLTRVELRYTTP